MVLETGGSKSIEQFRIKQTVFISIFILQVYKRGLTSRRAQLVKERCQLDLVGGKVGVTAHDHVHLVGNISGNSCLLSRQLPLAFPLLIQGEREAIDDMGSDAPSFGISSKHSGLEVELVLADQFLRDFTDCPLFVTRLHPKGTTHVRGQWCELGFKKGHKVGNALLLLSFLICHKGDGKG